MLLGVGVGQAGRERRYREYVARVSNPSLESWIVSRVRAFSCRVRGLQLVAARQSLLT